MGRMNDERSTRMNDGAGVKGDGDVPHGPTISLFGRRIQMPRSRFLRILLGVVLIFLGTLGFLPVLGFWMIPVGLLVLSSDIAMVRRWRRRMEVWWANRSGRRGGSRD